MMLSENYGIKILLTYLPEAESKAMELNIEIHVEELALSPNHIAVSCALLPGSQERRDFDNFLRLLHVREVAATQA